MEYRESARQIVISPLKDRIDRLRDEFRHRITADAEPRVLVSPYRICPIGAHVDHQGGPVLGTAIDAETLLAFVPSSSTHCLIESENFGERWEIQSPSESEPPDGWRRYFWAAFQTLSAHLDAKIRRGVLALAQGTLPGSGLSSSASVVLAYLSALAEVNEVSLSDRELVQLARRAENEYVGVKCGILDPACIVASQRDHLVSIDTQSCSWEAVAGDSATQSRFLVAFSGVGRNLRHTGFNDRVDQCHAAARQLGSLTDNPSARALGDHDDSIFEAHLHALGGVEQKRARHFFEERRRVLAGIDAWRRGDLATFGELMNDSCRSSIENFEVGSQEILALHRLVRSTPGIYGARFSGAGFGGCVVALADGDRAEACAEEITRQYRKLSPELADARVFVAQSRDGLHTR